MKCLVNDFGDVVQAFCDNCAASLPERDRNRLVEIEEGEYYTCDLCLINVQKAVCLYCSRESYYYRLDSLPRFGGENNDEIVGYVVFDLCKECLDNFIRPLEVVGNQFCFSGLEGIKIIVLRPEEKGSRYRFLDRQLRPCS